MTDMILSDTIMRPGIYRDPDTQRILSGIHTNDLNKESLKRNGIVYAVWAEYARQTLESVDSQMELSESTDEIAEAFRTYAPEIGVVSSGSGHILSGAQPDEKIGLVGNDEDGIFLVIGSERIDISEMGPRTAVLFSRNLFKAYDSVRRKCWLPL